MNKDSISKASETDWEALEKMEDEDVDKSDIPEVNAEQMAQARLRVCYRTLLGNGPYFRSG